MTGPWSNGWRGQGLAVGLVVIAIGAIWFGGVGPLRSWYDQREALLNRRQTVLREMHAAVVALPRLRSLPGRDGGPMASATTGVLHGATDALAAAGLQERVQRWAAMNGATLATVDTMPVTIAGDWHKVGLRISASGSWVVLMAVLRSIEESGMLVDDLHFRSAGMVTRSTTLPIQASMVVFGFRPAAAQPGA